jgi:hypothetical protein
MNILASSGQSGDLATHSSATALSLPFIIALWFHSTCCQRRAAS